MEAPVAAVVAGEVIAADAGTGVAGAVPAPHPNSKLLQARLYQCRHTTRFRPRPSTRTIELVGADAVAGLAAGLAAEEGMAGALGAPRYLRPSRTGVPILKRPPILELHPCP